MFGQARVTARHVPRNTSCRHKPTLPLHDYKRVSNTPAPTPEHKNTWNYSHANTLTPIPTPPPPLQPAESCKPHSLFGLEPQNRWFQKKQKAQKCGNTALPCLDKPLSGQGGGGGGTGSLQPCGNPTGWSGDLASSHKKKMPRPQSPPLICTPNPLGTPNKRTSAPIGTDSGAPCTPHLLKWRRWERAVGRAMGDEARIVEVLASIPTKISAQGVPQPPHPQTQNDSRPKTGLRKNQL